jgi:hypothetical protein
MGIPTIYNYKLSTGHMLFDMFHTAVLDTLTLTADNPTFLIKKHWAHSDCDRSTGDSS